MGNKEIKRIPLFLTGIIMLMLLLAAPAFADDLTEYNIHFKSFVDEKDATLFVGATPDGHDAQPIKDGYRLPEGYYIIADAFNNSDSRDMVVIQLDGDGIVQQTDEAKPGRSGFLSTRLNSDITYILHYADENIITFTKKTQYGADVSLNYILPTGESIEVSSGEPVPGGGFLRAIVQGNGYYDLSLYLYQGKEFRGYAPIPVGGKNGFIYPSDIITGLHADITLILDDGQGEFQPAGTKISKLTPGHKQMTVKWKKPAEKVTGYELRYSKSKSFKSGVKKKRITNADTVKCKLTGLKKGKRYYVQIRTYLNLDGQKTYYSNWSKKQSVRVK